MTEPVAGQAAGKAWLCAGIFVLVAVWIAWLRQPALTTPVWNVDEGITAAIADEILAGGVPFRDATDLRAPLTYYFYAAVFAVGGRNNMAAIHVAHTAMVIATALLVLLVARRTGGAAAAGWGAWIYAGLACTVFNPLDNFALHTEWPLAFCSAAGALLYLAGSKRRQSRWLAAAGACYGLAALSKQPALLDFGAPLALQAWGMFLGPASERRSHWRGTIALLLGFAAPLALTLGYFAARGALQDFIYYTWTYNTRYYVPEVPLAARFPTVQVPLKLFHAFAPSLLVMLGLALVVSAARLIRRPESRANGDFIREAFAPLWLVGALAATTLSGRGFEHYSIQVLAPASLVAAQFLGPLTAWALAGLGAGTRRLGLGLAVIAALVAIAGIQFQHATAYRAAVKPHWDPGVVMAKVIREATTREDRIFVWGFYSDLHTLSDRLPASRFVHGAFLTGLIPWTNLGRDTSYAIVPGSMETLLADLEKNRPRMIVDASPSLNRQFQGYPPEKFPAFFAYLQQHYLECEPQRSEPRGWFRFYLRRDEASFATTADAAAPAGEGLTAESLGIHGDFSGITLIAVRGSDPTGRLGQLGLLVNDTEFHGASFPPVGERRLLIPLPDATANIRVVARTTDGRRVVSALLPRPAPPAVPAGLRLETAQGGIQADALATIHPPSAVQPDGQPAWLCHAYTAARFPLPAGAQRLQLGYGLVPAAYENPVASTDGVEFIVRLQPREGPSVILHRRWLNPRDLPPDRGTQTVEIDLSQAKPGDSLVLITHPGTAFSNAYDWSYWRPRLELAPETP